VGAETYGINRIRRRADGCLLLEDYSSVGGLTGTSINYYDPSSSRWHQHWVDSGNSIIRLEGGLEDGSMRLQGPIYFLTSGATAPIRGSWTLLPDGRVRQLVEQQNTSGTWELWFDGYYQRYDSSSAGSTLSFE